MSDAAYVRFRDERPRIYGHLESHAGLLLVDVAERLKIGVVRNAPHRLYRSAKHVLVRCSAEQWCDEANPDLSFASLAADLGIRQRCWRIEDRQGAAPMLHPLRHDEPPAPNDL